MYSGNLGRVHSFDEIATAIDLLRTEPRIVFLFVGAGASLDSMKAFVSSRKLDNVQFLPLQPPNSLSDSLGAADLHLVSLKAGMEDLVMPSKLYGILAAGRPVAFVGESDGDLARLVTREQVGFAVAHGDGAGLATGIRRLAGDRALQQQLSCNARRLFESEFTSEKRFEDWRTLLESLGSPS
jgi:glycosyltransferase involved in cell wall biosynthesis